MAYKENAQRLKEILKQYEVCSGQLINLEKSSLFFSKKLKEEEKEETCKILDGVQIVVQRKHLGLPMVVTTRIKNKEDFPPLMS